MATGLTPEQQQRVDDIFKTAAMSMGEALIDMEAKGAALVARLEAEIGNKP